MSFTSIKFIFSLALFSFLTALISIGWPKFTSKPRPEALKYVYDTISDTPFGKELGSVLGVSAGQTVEPVNMQQIAGDVTRSLVTSAEQQARNSIARHAIIQLMNQYEKLPDEQRNQIKEYICVTQPVATDSATPSSSIAK